MVKVSAGCGERTGRRPNCLDAFLIDVSEVTREAYARCVARARCAAPRIAGCVEGNEAEYWRQANLPVTCVSLEDAMRYCAFMGKRLPREEEWVRAGRMGSKRKYPWGDEAPTCERVAGLIRWGKGGTRRPCPAEGIEGAAAPMAVADSGSPPLRLAPVCSRAAGHGPNGICDLAGNAGEWVDARPPKDSRVPSARLIKGASPLGAEEDFLGLDARAWITAPANPTVGFRCAQRWVAPP